MTAATPLHRPYEHVVLERETFLVFATWINTFGLTLTQRAAYNGKPAHWLIGETPRDNHTQLTKRELQILIGVATGKSNAEIAAELHVSLDTAKTHVYRLFRKLGVHDRAAAVHTAWKLGIFGGDR